jgi:hypothetical protein
MKTSKKKTRLRELTEEFERLKHEPKLGGAAKIETRFERPKYSDSVGIKRVT